jgi:hypothetical protein
MVEINAFCWKSIFVNMVSAAYCIHSSFFYNKQPSLSFLYTTNQQYGIARLGNLPPKTILGNLFDGYKKPIECRLINRHWFFASIGVAYHSVQVNDSDEDGEQDNWEKLDKFCTLLKNPCYNIGPYVKKFSSCLLEHDLDLLVVITYCPNIEVIDFSLDNEKLCDYIISVVRGRVKRNYG